MATVCCIHGIETGHHYCRECADMAADIEWSHRRISELEAELAKAKLELQQEAEADIQTMATIKNIEADNARLRACLKRIAEATPCDERCAALMARDWLNAESEKGK